MSDIFNVGADPLSYSGLAVMPPAVVSIRAPLSTDIAYPLGQEWVDTTAGSIYFLGSVIAGVATWNLSGVGATGAIVGITGDSGGQEVPNGAGNFNILGTANQVTTTGTANTQTLSIPAAFVAPGSITSTTGITAGTTLTSAGATTLATTGASTNTFGNTTGATALTLSVGTGNFLVDGVGASTFSIGPSTTTGTVTIGGTAETGAITLGRSTAGDTVNIANGVGGNTIAIGNGANTSAQTVSIANGASAANSTVSILSGVGTAGAGVLALGNNTRVTTIGLGNIAPAAARVTTIAGGNSAQNDTVNVLAGAPSAGTQTVNILTGTSTGGTQAVNIATGASASTTTIGNATGATKVQILGGTGGIVLTPVAGNISVAPGTATVASPTASSTINDRLGCVTFTGFTTAATGTQAFTITNSNILTTSAVHVTITNLNASTNGAQMTIQNVTQAAGSIIVNTKNNGGGALGAGDNVLINFWIMS
jgi:hypothetical protein